MIGRRLALVAAAALVVAGCGGGTHTGAAPPPQLRSIDQLRAAFDAAPTEPRLIVLISPT